MDQVGRSSRHPMVTQADALEGLPQGLVRRLIALKGPSLSGRLPGIDDNERSRPVGGQGFTQKDRGGEELKFSVIHA